MGRLIVIDGLDGSGKSTQLARLHAHLDAADIAYTPISFPDYDQPSSALVKLYLSGAFGESADAVNAYAASSFYAVDRYASFKQFWQADYESDRLVVAARYTTSNAIHQMSKLPEAQWDAFLEWLFYYEYEQLGLPKPDCVIFLDMPLDIAQQLLAARYEGDESKKDIHERDKQYLQTCRKAALYAAEKCGWQVITCGRDGKPDAPEEITVRLLDSIKGVL
ncbi:MAG: deoxynucleoside kinase [Clostridia bacterium]|nr:deoxynucleoside kinase [Clostridia bacterium]